MFSACPNSSLETETQSQNNLGWKGTPGAYLGDKAGTASKYFNMWEYNETRSKGAWWTYSLEERGMPVYFYL